MKNPFKKSKKAPSKAQEHMESFSQNYGWALICHPYFNNNPDVHQPKVSVALATQFSVISLAYENDHDDENAIKWLDRSLKIEPEDKERLHDMQVLLSRNHQE